MDAKVTSEKSAIKEINKSIKLKSNDSSYFLLRGQLQKKFGDINGARKSFQYILDRFDPNNEEAKKEISSL